MLPCALQSKVAKIFWKAQKIFEPVSAKRMATNFAKREFYCRVEFRDRCQKIQRIFREFREKIQRKKFRAILENFSEIFSAPVSKFVSIKNFAFWNKCCHVFYRVRFCNNFIIESDFASGAEKNSEKFPRSNSEIEDDNEGSSAVVLENFQRDFRESQQKSLRNHRFFPHPSQNSTR